MPERVASGLETIDVLVIGGGITGCAVARDAAARGFRVRLVERRDLAAGTSGRSTKLLHGGLRYLEHGHLGLVRESLREREITARLAPGLATPLRLVLPVWPDSSPGRFAARIGVALYGWLAGASALPGGGPVDRASLAAAVPSLRGGFTGGVAFYDRQTDDARLTVAIARDAVRRGAAIELGTEVVALDGSGGPLRVTLRDESGRSSTIEARCVVNATGAWADRVRRLRGDVTPLLRSSRGAHLVLRRPALGTALLLPGRQPEHRLFAIPWRGVVLFGTTDVPDEVDPGCDEASDDDLRLLLDEARRAFPSAELTRGDVLSAFTGVRPLVRYTGNTLAASREHVVRDEAGVITIAGGKLTTWRTMAIAAVDAAARRLRARVASPVALLHEPLPGGDSRPPELESVLSEEMPRHVDDVVFRRLPVGHDPEEVHRILPEIVTRMSVREGWGPARAKEESERVLNRLEAQSRRLDEVLGKLPVR